MILYYLNMYTVSNGAPFELTDPNIAGDYAKLSSMFDLYTENIKKQTVLQKLMGGEAVAGRLVTSFNLSTDFSYNHFISLLYYLGLLTIDTGLDDGGFLFRTPNRVIRTIYYDYYFEYLAKRFHITDSMVMEALLMLEEDGDISRVVSLVETIICESTAHNNRYLIHFRKNTLQTLFYLILSKSDDYRAKMEYQMGNRFIDVSHAPVQDGVSYVLELKYLSQARYDENPLLLDEQMQEVHRQIEADVKSFGNTKVAGIGLIFVGKECRHQEMIS